MIIACLSISQFSFDAFETSQKNKQTNRLYRDAWVCILILYKQWVSNTNMQRETITLQAGQCGNQVASEFWSQIASEHGILPDGTSLSYKQDEEAIPNFEGYNNRTLNEREDRAELFFTLSDSGKYTPRSVLVDLEPSVIQRTTNMLPMYNPRNIHLSEVGNGAANNWLKGYAYGVEHSEDLLEIIDRECDKCENLSNFQLIHSVAGGTGSGVGSYLLEAINDRYGSKKLIGTSLIFPSSEKTSDVIVQPYNTLLTLKRLIDFSDSSIVFDNDSMNKIENTIFGLSQTSDIVIGNGASNNAFKTTNKLISYVISSVSNPIRFPSYMYSSYESIVSTLIPTPDLKFLTASVAPFADLSMFNQQPMKQNLTNLNEYDLILELLDDKYKMNKSGTEKLKYISMLTYLIGNNLDQEEIRKGKLRALKRLEFVPWTASSISIVNGKRTQMTHTTGQQKHLNGLLISNNTSVIPFFIRILKQYDSLAKRGAFINSYMLSNDSEERDQVLQHFNECKESVLHVIEEYKSCQTMSYLEDDILEEDDIMA